MYDPRIPYVGPSGIGDGGGAGVKIASRMQPVPREPYANSYGPDHWPPGPMSCGPRDFAGGGRPPAQPTWEVEQERRNAEWEQRRERQRSLREQQKPIAMGGVERGERVRGPAFSASSGIGSAIAGRASHGGVDRERYQGQEVTKAPEKEPQIEEQPRAGSARGIRASAKQKEAEHVEFRDHPAGMHNDLMETTRAGPANASSAQKRIHLSSPEAEKPHGIHAPKKLRSVASFSRIPEQ
ncbi:hypothetical protein HK097_002295 [Rhizophlyctis rosea]|uniref:Uncharacterized protein n=1 Tax=Rhizophlyctis rosea TaxID=64517 RepID=A0AAD5S655_9FUNG|nr:hypothetical protein HK097_002295 [Rhizophlyctis rosea]